MNSNAESWVAALRSGQYKQGTQSLGRKTPEGDVFCCLGVACELAIQAGLIPPRTTTGPIMGDGGGQHYEYDGAPGVLSVTVRDWLGLIGGGGSYGSFGSALTKDNDHGMTFDQIADLIESEPAGLFVP